MVAATVFVAGGGGGGLCLSSGRLRQRPARVAPFLKLRPEKNLAVEYGGKGISKDQQVVRVTVTTPPLQSQYRNSHIPRSYMHVHSYGCVGKHEVTLPWPPLCVSSVWCSCVL